MVHKTWGVNEWTPTRPAKQYPFLFLALFQFGNVFPKVVASLLLLTLSGCVGEPPATILGDCERPSSISNPETRSRDWSLETLRVQIEGPHDALIPVPIHRATNVTHWSTLSGAPAMETEHGVLLHFVGESSLDATYCVVQPAWGGNGCCAEHYIDAYWSSQKSDDNELLWAHLNGSTVTVTYEAISDYCGIDPNDATWTLQGTGWLSTDAFIGGWCT